MESHASGEDLRAKSRREAEERINRSRNAHAKDIKEQEAAEAKKEADQRIIIEESPEPPSKTSSVSREQDGEQDGRPNGGQAGETAAGKDVPNTKSGKSTNGPARTSKRPAPEDDADTSKAAKPKAHKHSIPSTVNAPEEKRHHVGEERPPKWYNDIKNPTTRDSRNNDSGVDLLLQRLKDQTSKCKNPAFERDYNMRREVFDRIRTIIHKLFFFAVDAKVLKGRRILHNEDGLPRLFDDAYSGGVNWPFDIRADAHELYNKWCRRIFEIDILRGITWKKAKAESKSDANRLDKDYTGKVDCDYFGNGDLINGQWWPLQLCALRDGAHGHTVAGISGKTGEGAYSCVMSGGHSYEDEDHGDWILYCGTDNTNADRLEPTDSTKLLIENLNSSKPVRLLRSSNVPSAYAPKEGLRYDGLYDVTECENLDGPGSFRQRHRFRFVRRQNQDPIRGGDRPELEKRPTEQELDEFKKHKQLSGKMKG